MRDDFSSTTIAELRKRAGEKCSNPKCGTPTSGPRFESGKSISIGVAAHIYAASSGGPRFNVYMSDTQRSSIDNAIWLCQNCAKLIDNDESRYTPEALFEWKSAAEALAFKNISERVSLDSETELVCKSTVNTVREIIELGDNNKFVGDDTDLRNLATRCAIHVINEKAVDFDVRLLATNLVAIPSDPLLMPQYEAGRRKKAEQLKKWMTTITSPNVNEWWRCYLGRVDEWQLAISTLMERARIGVSMLCGHSQKIDVWRTSQPKLCVSIYLSEIETTNLLTYLNFTSTRDLQLGAYWRAVSDMPQEIIAKHVIPRIVLELVQCNISAEGAVLNLAEWHIGAD